VLAAKRRRRRGREREKEREGTMDNTTLGRW